jgi:tetratricopeptide (TPR) repeat protein
VQFLAGNIATGLPDWPNAPQYFLRTIEIEPNLPDAYLRLKNPMILSGRAEELVSIFERALIENPSMPLERLTAFAFLQKRAIANDLPDMLVVTMPRTGSLYILMRLSTGLSIPVSHVSLNLFPKDHVIPCWARTLATGGTVAQEHIDASPENLAHLREAGIDKLCVHTRDPRQATLMGTPRRIDVRQTPAPPTTNFAAYPGLLRCTGI